MFERLNIALRTYGILSAGVLVTLWILRPQWGSVLWPATIVNVIFYAWAGGRLLRLKESERSR